MRRGEQPAGRPLLIVIEEYGDLIRQLRTAKRRRRPRRQRARSPPPPRPQAWHAPAARRPVPGALVAAGHRRHEIQSGFSASALNQGAKMEEYHAANCPTAAHSCTTARSTNPGTPSPPCAACWPPSRPPRRRRSSMARAPFGRSVRWLEWGLPLERTHRTNDRTPRHRTPTSARPTSRNLSGSGVTATPDGSQCRDAPPDSASVASTISKGYAHELWHRWPGPTAPPPGVIDLSTAAGPRWLAANAGAARLPGGDKLGTDISH